MAKRNTTAARYSKYLERFNKAQESMSKAGLSMAESTPYSLQEYEVMYQAYKNDNPLEKNINRALVKAQTYEFQDISKETAYKIQLLSKNEPKDFNYTLRELKANKNNITSDFINNYYQHLTLEAGFYASVARDIISSEIFGSP